MHQGTHNATVGGLLGPLPDLSGSQEAKFLVLLEFWLREVPGLASGKSPLPRQQGTSNWNQLLEIRENPQGNSARAVHPSPVSQKYYKNPGQVSKSHSWVSVFLILMSYKRDWFMTII